MPNCWEASQRETPPVRPGPKAVVRADPSRAEPVVARVLDGGLLRVAQYRVNSSR